VQARVAPAAGAKGEGGARRMAARGALRKEAGEEAPIEPEHNLVIAELVNAHLKAKAVLSYQVVGELRIVPVRGGTRAADFRFRLRNTNRVEQLKLNDRFVKATAPGEYLVSLPALSDAQPVPLLKYITTARWRPIPLFVNATVAPAAGPAASLSAVVEANPQLKMPLQHVSIFARPGEHAEACDVAPPGTWEEGKLQWTLPRVLSSKDVPVPCSAQLTGSEELAAALGAQPLHVHFGCEGVTISGLELEVQVGARGSPIARLLRRFAAGDYKVTPTVEEKSEGE